MNIFICVSKKKYSEIGKEKRERERGKVVIIMENWKLYNNNSGSSSEYDQMCVVPLSKL